MRRRLMDSLRSACEWDDHFRMGCRQGCACHWLEQCAPRYEFVRSRTGDQFVDVGYCAPSYFEPFVVTILLPMVMLFFVILIRHLFSLLDPSSSKKLHTTAAATFSANVRALCESSKVKGGPRGPPSAVIGQ
eukprot:s601_g10.t1